VERFTAEQERTKNIELEQEDSKDKADLDWADKMEQEELAQIKAKAAETANAKPADPTQDPENIKWMEEQMKLNKAQFGDTFGEDLEVKFEE
jgi:hypothetical protein